MNDQQKDLIQFLETGFGLTVADTQSLDTESALLKYLLDLLSKRIEFFINSDLDKLMQILYRIDVDDQMTDRAFNMGEIKKISYCLAELIIQRQLQKLNYSRSFNS